MIDLISIMDKVFLRSTTGYRCLTPDGLTDEEYARKWYASLEESDTTQAVKLLEENGRWYIWYIGEQG